MSATKRKIVLKKLSAHKTIWHPESTLVFKSQKERLVIGRYVDKKLIPLDEEALDLCDEWRFKPDDSLLAEEEEEEAVATEEESPEEEEAPSAEDEEAPEEEEAPSAEEEEETEIVPTPKQVSKPAPKEKSHVATIAGNGNIRSITEGFTIQLYAMVEQLQNQITTLEGERDQAQSSLEAADAALTTLRADHAKIKKKFDTMKSLFA